MGLGKTLRLTCRNDANLGWNPRLIDKLVANRIMWDRLLASP